jgi:ATP-dependent Lhr-like helicase
MLDEVLAAGEVTWTGHGSLGAHDGWVCLWPGDIAPLAVAEVAPDLTATARSIRGALLAGGAWTVEALTESDMSASETQAAVWELVWAGLATCDTWAALRALSGAAGVLRRPSNPRVRRVVRPRAIVRSPQAATRWFAPATEDLTPAARQIQAISLELGRYAVLTKGSVVTEAMTPSFFVAYKVLAAMEDQRVVRRGYFIDGLGAAQFALPGAVDRLRESTNGGLVLLAACDPANPWGAALAWPESMGHRPTRVAGAIVVLDDGQPVIYVEKGAHTLITFTEDPDSVVSALRLVGQWIDQRRLDTITITRINLTSALKASEWVETLERGGWTMVPQGFRRRAQV